MKFSYSILIFGTILASYIDLTKTLPTTTSATKRAEVSTNNLNIVENKLSFLAISKFLDSFKLLPSNAADESAKNIENKHRRQLDGFNNTAVSRIASQGYGLFNSLMQLASSANTTHVPSFFAYKFYTAVLFLYYLITKLN